MARLVILKNSDGKIVGSTINGAAFADVIVTEQRLSTSVLTGTLKASFHSITVGDLSSDTNTLQVTLKPSDTEAGCTRVLQVIQKDPGKDAFLPDPMREGTLSSYVVAVSNEPVLSPPLFAKFEEATYLNINGYEDDISVSEGQYITVIQLLLPEPYATYEDVGVTVCSVGSVQVTAADIKGE